MHRLHAPPPRAHPSRHHSLTARARLARALLLSRRTSSRLWRVQVASLLLEAAVWSPRSHHTFPAEARARAAELMRIGYLFAHGSDRGRTTELVDVWRGHVVPFAVERE